MTPKPKAKDRILGAFLKPVKIGAGPVSFTAPAIVAIPLVTIILTAVCIALYLWLKTPEPVRKHKVHEVRGILK